MSPVTVGFAEDVEIQRLDGARWLNPQSSLLQLLSTHFKLVDSPPCVKQLKSHSVKYYRRPPRPPLSGHLCKIESKGRAWEGIQDLSASVSALQDLRTLYLDIWVHDPGRSKRDEITLWFGKPQSPKRLRFNRSGVLGNDKLRDQVLFKWTEFKPKRRSGKGSPRRARDVSQDENSLSEPFEGYLASIEIPLSIIKGHLSVRVRDVDPALGGAELQMWAIGAPPAVGEPIRPEPIEVY